MNDQVELDPMDEAPTAAESVAEERGSPAAKSPEVEKSDKVDSEPTAALSEKEDELETRKPDVRSEQRAGVLRLESSEDERPAAPRRLLKKAVADSDSDKAASPARAAGESRKPHRKLVRKQKQKGSSEEGSDAPPKAAGRRRSAT
jgi:hypothetical protein